MKSNLDEKSLVKAVLQNDRSACIALIRQYEKLILHIVGPLIKGTEDKEDICQEIFLNVFKNLNNFQFKSKLSSWIAQIAYNTSVNFLQKKKFVLIEDFKNNHTPDEQQSFPDSIEHEDPHKIYIKKERNELLDEAMEKLLPLQRSILLLFHNDGLSLEEISKLYEIPVNTIKSHLFRSRARLKELLLHHKYQAHE